MPITKVRTKWVSGQLQFLDTTGSVLFFIDSTGKKLDFTFAKIDVSGGSTEASLGAKQVSSGVLTTAAVKEAKIAANAITSGKISTGAVKEAKIAGSAITSGKIAALAVKAAKVAASAIASSAVAANAINAAKIADESLDGQHPANSADNSTTPVIPVTYVIKTTTVAAAAARTTATLKTLVLAEKVRILDVTMVQLAAITATTDVKLRVSKGGSAISNAINGKVADASVLRASTIDDAQWVAAAGSSIRIRGENASSKGIPAVTVFIHAVKSA